MWLFRKSLDLSRAITRPVALADLTAVSRLLRDGVRRYYNLSGSDLPALLAAGQGVALEVGGELHGVAMVSWPSEETCWLRALALAEGLEVRAGTATLMSALHGLLAERKVRVVYFSGDDATEVWLTPALQQEGYLADTEMVVYEKLDLRIPGDGNLDVAVRPAERLDLVDVMRLDRLCFEPQWTKDDTILGPAIEYGSYFIVAELDAAVVGYAYATTHFGGRLVHLVRIAVDPACRGAQIGVRLLAEVVMHASIYGASMLTLNTQAYNTHAQRLYHWFGFAPSGERQTVLRRLLG